MKIVLTGGGTGGHFYPLIAVAERINDVAAEEKLLKVGLYYFADKEYDKESLFENGITYMHIGAGKRRLYRSISNFFDIFKTASGVLGALLKLFAVYPDVVFSKGGYAAFPTVLAARILRIPVVIHESDSIPGRVNLWTAKFAKRIAISYDEAIEYFPKNKTALTGQPVRKEILKKETQGAFEFLKLDPTIPVILVVGGSLGAESINNTLLEALPELLAQYQVIHMTGPKNFDDIIGRAGVILEKNENSGRYKAFGSLNTLALKMSAGAATLVVSRAGSMIFEIAGWGIPSIIIPISRAVSRDQEANAFNYARSGACEVIEEVNLTPSILAAEINKLIGNKVRMEQMSKNAVTFAKGDAALTIARELISIGLSHES